MVDKKKAFIFSWYSDGGSLITEGFTNAFLSDTDFC